MEITGRIIQKLPLQSGTSKAGRDWKKQGYVLETQDTAYPKKVYFTLFGDRADQYPLEQGEDVTVSFDLESREYQGRWYTDVVAWKAEKVTAAAPGAAPAAASAAPAPAAEPVNYAGAAPQEAAPVPDFSQTSAEDDLPF